MSFLQKCWSWIKTLRKCFAWIKALGRGKETRNTLDCLTPPQKALDDLYRRTNPQSARRWRTRYTPVVAEQEPSCDQCGTVMVPDGACWKCLNCRTMIGRL